MGYHVLNNFRSCETTRDRSHHPIFNFISPNVFFWISNDCMCNAIFNTKLWK